MSKLLKRNRTGKHAAPRPHKPHRHRKQDCVVCALDAVNERLLVM